jgi:benzoate-CoA ligase
MWVKGDSLGLGYWQNQDKTREAFFGPWYRSQDLICRDADGYITYCGRSGDMFKVAGRWVASKEIENCLLQHEQVKEAAVVGMTDPATGLTKPNAFVIVHTPKVGIPEALKQHVLDSLEAYKTPRHITVVDSLPRTHLGKVDRGKLRTL